MNLYLAITILICLSAGFSFLNQRLLKLPFAIGLFVLSTILSLFVISSKLWLNALPSLWREQLGMYRSIAHQSLQGNYGTTDRTATANRRYHKE